MCFLLNGLHGRNARKRCKDPKNKYWKWYGGRGINFCKEWDDSFRAFLESVGPKSSKELTLDRTDNDRGYEPGNCRWVDMKTQCSNRRRRQNKFPRQLNRKGKKIFRYPPEIITIEGKTKTLQEWNDSLGYKSNSLYCFKRERSMTYPEVIKFKLSHPKHSKTR